jgi:hypothetical protein
MTDSLHPCNSAVELRREAALFNKTLHDNPYQSPVSMILRSYNLNPVFTARPRWQGFLR